MSDLLSHWLEMFSCQGFPSNWSERVSAGAAAADSDWLDSTRARDNMPLHGTLLAFQETLFITRHKLHNFKSALFFVFLGFTRDMIFQQNIFCYIYRNQFFKIWSVLMFREKPSCHLNDEVSLTMKRPIFKIILWESTKQGMTGVQGNNNPTPSHQR